MTDWNSLRSTYSNEVSTNDWLGALLLGVLASAAFVSFVREPRPLNGAVLLLTVGVIVVRILAFRSRLRSMREQDRSGWTRPTS